MRNPTILSLGTVSRFCLAKTIILPHSKKTNKHKSFGEDFRSSPLFIPHFWFLQKEKVSTFPIGNVETFSFCKNQKWGIKRGEDRKSSPKLLCLFVFLLWGKIIVFAKQKRDTVPRLNMVGLRTPRPRILFFYEKSIQKRIKEEVSSLKSSLGAVPRSDAGAVTPPWCANERVC